MPEHVKFILATTEIDKVPETIRSRAQRFDFQKISEKNNVDLRESAAILDIFSCIFQGLIPYGAQMLILLGFAGDKVAPTQLIPLLWYQLLLGVFTLIYIFIPQISKKVLNILDKNVEKK